MIDIAEKSISHVIRPKQIFFYILHDLGQVLEPKTQFPQMKDYQNNTILLNFFAEVK